MTEVEIEFEEVPTKSALPFPILDTLLSINPTDVVEDIVTDELTDRFAVTAEDVALGRPALGFTVNVPTKP